MEEWQEKYKQILNGEEPDAAEQRLTAAKDEATKAADTQNENINKLKLNSPTVKVRIKPCSLRTKR
ncbi:hypothetical protein DW079_12820 [Segatella copri]|uniref:Uncharacterized protein n=1 Tax=Segatella copri TaxID=165179 RepID=A0A415EZ49_9BACT|nr:hypothetical protein DW079_12820 [Segatella copri]